MGAVQVEIFRMGNKNKKFPGVPLDQMPLQVSTETSTTTATTAGSRIACNPSGNQDRDFYARLTADEIVFAAVGVNPTVTNATGWKIMPNGAVIVPCKRGDLFSFKDLA